MNLRPSLSKKVRKKLDNLLLNDSTVEVAQFITAFGDGPNLISAQLNADSTMDH